MSRLTRLGSERVGSLALVVAAHLGLLWWAVTSRSTVVPPAPQPPALIGILVSPKAVDTPPDVPPPTRPKQAQAALPQPTPTPVPAAIAPVPKAPPSERAVTAPPAAPPVETRPAPAPATAQPTAQPTVAPAPPAATPPVHEAPMTLPSSKAAYLNNPEPVYPPKARRLGQEGIVQLHVLVLASGNVGDIKVKTSSGFPLLDESALSTFRTWRFVPAKRGDQAVDYWYDVAYEFKLH